MPAPAPRDLFALPKSLFDAKTGALTLPAFGTPEFVNAVTVRRDRGRRALGRPRSRAARDARRKRASSRESARGGVAEDARDVARRAGVGAKRTDFAGHGAADVRAADARARLGLARGTARRVVVRGREERRAARAAVHAGEHGRSRGSVTFVIKAYKPCEKFPLGGKVSQHLDGLRVGDSCDFDGPKGMKTYEGGGVFAIRRLRSQGGGFEKRKCSRVGMIAGGSGITPMLQISRAILDNGDKVKMNLLFANQTEADILCREEIESDVAKYGADKFSADYTLDRPPKAGWSHFCGFITKEMIEKTMPPPGKRTQILICGPPPMLKFAVLPALEELGYTKDMILTW